MAYKDAEKNKEYQRQYYRNRTKLRRLRGEVKASRSKYEKVPEWKKRRNRKEANKKRMETLYEKYGGEEGVREYFSTIGKKGAKNSTPHITQENASEMGKLGARARGLKSKHYKTRQKYEQSED